VQRFTFLLSTVPLSLIMAPSAQSAPVNDTAGQKLLAKADRSFSPLIFDTPIKKSRVKVKPVDCDEPDGCKYVDENHVLYEVWEPNDEVVVKWIEAKDFRGRPIRALGIGMARSKAQALQAASRFLNGRKPQCGPDTDFGRPKITLCFFGLGEGWTKLWFDKDKLLTLQVTEAYLW
jgi:hypothetical protein